MWYNNIFYTWTSKIEDPSERYTPCIDTILLKGMVWLLEFWVNPGFYTIPIYGGKVEDCFIRNLGTDLFFSTSSTSGVRSLPFSVENLTLYNNISNTKRVLLFKLGNSMFKNHIHNNVNDNNYEKKETISRSNKYISIISEKSKNHIILGCKGKTYLEKLNTFFDEWYNYYIVRPLNSSEIIIEYHCSVNDKCWNDETFHTIPDELKNLINEKCVNLKNKYNSEDKLNNLDKDVIINGLTEMFSLLKYQRICVFNQNEDNKWVLDKDLYERFKSAGKTTGRIPNPINNHIDEYCNISQVYLSIDNIEVNITRIENFSSQPTYYNNLIKRYRKELKNILDKWIAVPVPNNNLTEDSITKISNKPMNEEWSKKKINKFVKQFRLLSKDKPKDYTPEYLEVILNNHVPLFKKPIDVKSYKKAEANKLLLIEPGVYDLCDKNKKKKIAWNLKKFNVRDSILRKVNEVPRNFK
jgi:hypothetical protein